MISLEFENAIEIAPQTPVLLGWNLKGIIETFGVLIYDNFIGRLCIHPYRSYDPGTRTIPESSGIFQKQSSGI